MSCTCYALRDLVPFVPYKNVKSTHRGVLLLVKSNTPPWVFFTFFELHKWYQIAQTSQIFTFISMFSMPFAGKYWKVLNEVSDTKWVNERGYAANIYNTRKRHEICSKLTIKTPKQRQWRRSGVFIANFEHILHFFQCFYC